MLIKVAGARRGSLAKPRRAPATRPSANYQSGYWCFLAVIIVVPFLWVNGMTIWPFVLVRRPNPSARLLNHERIHLRQQLELGILPFYIWYFAEYGYWRLRGLAHYEAYRAIRFEREAFTHDENLTYLNKRRFWAFL